MKRSVNLVLIFVYMPAICPQFVFCLSPNSNKRAFWLLRLEADATTCDDQLFISSSSSYLYRCVVNDLKMFDDKSPQRGHSSQHSSSNADGIVQMQTFTAVHHF